MQEYQFKYISQCLCIFYLYFTYSAPTLHIIDPNGSCKEFLFVQLLFKSDNISRATVRGGTWVNDITKCCGAYHEILSLLLELFVNSHMSNDSLLSGKTKSFGKGIEEIYFCKNRMDRQFIRVDYSRADLKLCDNRITSVNFCTAQIGWGNFHEFRANSKVYLPNISDSSINQSLSSSNIWNAFLNAFAK